MLPRGFRFPNSLTVEHNTLGGGVIRHILRNRSTSAATYAATDRWFHYDQVGSVMAETDSSGALAQTHHQDAFGNTQASWSTGLWGGDKPGWHHNTKEYDADIGLVYMYSRFYNAETGTFASRAPYPPFMESPYSFAMGDPVGYFDPKGEFTLIEIGCYAALTGMAAYVAYKIWASRTTPTPTPTPTPVPPSPTPIPTPRPKMMYPTMTPLPPNTPYVTPITPIPPDPSTWRNLPEDHIPAVWQPQGPWDFSGQPTPAPNQTPVPGSLTPGDTRPPGPMW